MEIKMKMEVFKWNCLTEVFFSFRVIVATKSTDKKSCITMTFDVIIAGKLKMWLLRAQNDKIQKRSFFESTNQIIKYMRTSHRQRNRKFWFKQHTHSSVFSPYVNKSNRIKLCKIKSHWLCVAVENSLERTNKQTNKILSREKETNKRQNFSPFDVIFWSGLVVGFNWNRGLWCTWSTVWHSQRAIQCTQVSHSLPPSFSSSMNGSRETETVKEKKRE